MSLASNIFYGAQTDQVNQSDNYDSTIKIKNHFLSNYSRFTGRRSRICKCLAYYRFISKVGINNRAFTKDGDPPIMYSVILVTNQ